ncbi:hypothetical protein TNIN_92531 [Trichonephila inaurata madagascariensis]|uniref:Uncharacterized protein n=1 Tax=Trichonephila inaurata madagascariensis TaxID=2747483 RepID=A0A8X6YJL8_9ARAC|nr:hypothetical protein TNIN_92531 [Trichonephila inaurata madagascariensis]
MTSSLRPRNISKLHSLIVLLMTSLIGGGEGAWQDGIQPLIRVSQLGTLPVQNWLRINDILVPERLHFLQKKHPSENVMIPLLEDRKSAFLDIVVVKYGHICVVLIFS